MEAIKRLNQFCGNKDSELLIILDQQDGAFRREIVESSGRTMFGTDSRRHLIEPPIQAENHLYQTLHCADWICDAHAGDAGRGPVNRLIQSDATPIAFAAVT